MDKLFTDLQNSITTTTTTDTVTNTDSNVTEPTNKSFEAVERDKKTTNLLKRQQISSEKLNALLEQSVNTLSCGPICQKAKIEKELKQKYLDAQANIKNAPDKLETTRKNYYVFTEGRSFYNDMLEEELKKKAAVMGKMLAENFRDEIINAKTMLAYYNTSLNNSDYTKELYAVYLEKNKLIQNGIKNHHSDVLTNDRKTYYETEALEDLKGWYTFFLYFYYIVALTIFIGVLVLKTSLNWFLKIIIIVIAVAYPYYIDFITQVIYGFFHSAWKQLPKNVYNDL
jgi:hypothetical protein